MEIIVNRGCCHIDDRFLGCKGKGFFIFIESHNFVIRIVLADGFCNRTADQSDADDDDSAKWDGHGTLLSFSGRLASMKSSCSSRGSGPLLFGFEIINARIAEILCIG